MEKKQKDHGGVLITIYAAPTKINKPTQLNGWLRKPKWRKPTSAVGYNRRAELLAYTQRLRSSEQMAGTRSKSLNATRRLTEKRNAPNMRERRKWGTKIKGLFCLPRRSRGYQQMASPEKVGIFANLNLYLAYALQLQIQSSAPFFYSHLPGLPDESKSMVSA